MERFYDGDEEKIMDVFRTWIDLYCEDFTEESLILFNMFIADIKAKNERFDKWGDELVASLARQRELYIQRISRQAAEQGESHAEDATSNGGGGATTSRAFIIQTLTSGGTLPDEVILGAVPGFKDKTWPPIQIAMQLTTLEREMFKEIPLREYVVCLCVIVCVLVFL
jgi:hypothetical protein